MELGSAPHCGAFFLFGDMQPVHVDDEIGGYATGILQFLMVRSVAALSYCADNLADRT
jgi:hypothetical protein